MEKEKKLNISCLEQTNINHNNSVKSFAPDSCLIMRAFSHQYKLKLYMPENEQKKLITFYLNTSAQTTTTSTNLR